MGKLAINAETLIKLIRLVRSLIICTQFAADTYRLGSGNTVTGKVCDEKHKELTKLIDDTMQVLKEIETEIE
jgi:hypothetical protein